jgi:aryl-alcohol dehydrogenase-like predicted oxidoreductase
VEQRAVGTSGLRVSCVALGTMTWGRDTDEHEARDQVQEFVEHGGTLIDTADVYGDGRSEAIVGRLLREFAGEGLVLATKAGGVSVPGRRFDNSRMHLLDALDQSLVRLGVETIDLWQVHGWDPLTPIDETLEVLDSAVRSGKVRYVGLSNWSGWQSGYAAAHNRIRGLGALVSHQYEYSLLARGIESEVIPCATSVGVGILAWSPLGRGVLTGKYRNGTPADSRGASAHLQNFVTPYLTAMDRRIVDAVCTAAEGLGVAPLDVALAWTRDQPGVSSAIVGARTAAQLRGILGGIETVLPEEITTVLGEISKPDNTLADRS